MRHVYSHRTKSGCHLSFVHFDEGWDVQLLTETITTVCLNVFQLWLGRQRGHRLRWCLRDHFVLEHGLIDFPEHGQAC